MRIGTARAAVCALAMIGLASGALAANETERVKFAAGKSSATISGAVTGYDTRNYLLGARSGQTVSVHFSGDNNACYFNFIEPGAASAIHMGDVAGDSYEAKLNLSGDNRIEVYLMRSEARRGKTCKFTLAIAITG